MIGVFMQDFIFLLSKLDTPQLAKMMLKSAGRAAARMPMTVGDACEKAIGSASLVIDGIGDPNAENAVRQTENSTGHLMEIIAYHSEGVRPEDVKLVFAACGYCIWTYAGHHGLKKTMQKLSLGNDIMEYSVSDALDYLGGAIQRMGESELNAQYKDYLFITT